MPSPPRPPLDPALRQRLLQEARTPWRGLRRALWTALLASGGLGLGAWELKSRISYLNLNDVNRGVLTDYTVGCNWYWSDRTRWMFDWIHPITTDQTLYGATVSDLLAMRFDFNW